jgi:hypothetical protein
MLWYEAAHHFHNQPKNCIVGVEGSFDQDSRTAYIKVKMFGAGDVECTYWSKTMSAPLSHDDFTSEDIYNKFSGKIAQIINKIPEDFWIWLKDYRRRLSEQEGREIHFDYENFQWFSVLEEQSSNSESAQ